MWDNLVMALFLSCTADTLSGHGQEKSDFGGLLNFTFYSSLHHRKNHLYSFTFSCKFSAKHNVWSLPLENENNNSQQCFTHVHFMLARQAICAKKAWGAETDWKSNSEMAIIIM